MTPRRWALLALALVGAGAALVWQASDAPPATVGAAPDAPATSTTTVARAAPSTWRRYEHVSVRAPGAGFAMLLPPDYGEVDPTTGAAEGGRFRGPRSVITYEFDDRVPFVEPRADAGETSIAREDAIVNGRRAVFQTIRTSHGEIVSDVYFALTEPDAAKPLALTLFAVCATVEDCADIQTIGRSVTFRHAGE